MSSRRILLSTRSVLSRYSRAINSCDGPSFPSSLTSSIYYHRQQSIRGFGSTFPVFKGAEAEDTSVAAAEGAADGAEETEEDECPVWQNPLHHNNPEFKKVLAEDFAPGEEMPVVPLPPFSSDDSSVEAPPHIHDLANQIIALNLMELAALMDRIGEHFGFDDSADFGGDDGGDGGDGGSGAEVVQEEKTVFDLKLEGFDAKSKIKVIKEIRTVTGLGLKEAKELVEGAPTTIKKDIKMEEAEELKAKLEAAGATVSIA